MVKSPCLTCPNKDEDKRKHPACIDCEERIAYASAVTGPLARPSAPRKLKEPAVVESREASEQEEARAKAAATMGMVECSRCGDLRPRTEFEQKSGRMFKTCPACRAKDKKPVSIKNDAASDKKNGAGIPAGFIRYTHGRDRGKEFVSISEKGILLSAAVVKKLGRPKNVDIYFNPKTRQIGVAVNKEGSSTLSFKNGTGTASCTLLIRRNGIRPARRVPVEWHGEFVMTKGGQ